MFSRPRILYRLIQSENWLSGSGQVYFRRFRSGGGRSNPGPRPRRAPPDWFKSDHKHHDLRQLVKSYAKNWSCLAQVHRRFEGFGIPREHLPDLLSSFLADIRQGILSDEVQSQKFNLSRFTFASVDGYSSQRLDQIISQLFFTWASDPEKQRDLRTRVPESTLDIIARLHRLADLSYPADLYPKARSMKRKFIMHVGPTNSGKTHMALRALAASNSGLYAGPLRLLAHEIWERLNRGQIVPLGMEPEPGSEHDSTINVDVADETGSHPTVRKEGHVKYARQCNLLTGEEFRIVADNAPLVSATVEMACSDKLLDVAVVDEIQMIADPERGSSWTHAVLGLPAREIHLCGEETAVPIIKDILKHTGDELVVNRYERLTPLDIQESSLCGDLSQIQKGDCLVVFSRDGIFSMKEQVERKTGLRCAVAYGRLPPEVRSEQAALFNDPESGYDVIVASDAVGMGLNLKIKRVIFETLHKFNGEERRTLSISQIKQIAGRAGRYGLHGQPGGFVTTLRKEDIPTLRRALATPAPTLARAILDPPGRWMMDIAQALPLRASTRALLEAPSYVSVIRPPFQVGSQPRLGQLSDFMDKHAKDLLLADKLLFKHCPIQWTDPIALDLLAQILHLYTTTIRVGLDAVLSVSPFVGELRKVEKMMPSKPKHQACQNALKHLEGLHKALVVYLWLSFRNTIAFYDGDKALALKERAERALEWCLRHLSTGRMSKGVDHNQLESKLDYRHRSRRGEGGRDWEAAVVAARMVAASVRQ